MAIPASALILKIDVAQMTLGEAALFDGKISPSALQAFLVKRGNWSEAEVNGILISELPEVAEQINTQFKAAAVPLASAPPSANGHALKRKRHPRGSAH